MLFTLTTILRIPTYQHRKQHCAWCSADTLTVMSLVAHNLIQSKGVTELVQLIARLHVLVQNMQQYGRVNLCSILLLSHQKRAFSPLPDHPHQGPRTWRWGLCGRKNCYDSNVVNTTPRALLFCIWQLYTFHTMDNTRSPLEKTRLLVN